MSSKISAISKFTNFLLFLFFRLLSLIALTLFIDYLDVFLESKKIYLGNLDRSIDDVLNTGLANGLLISSVVLIIPTGIWTLILLRNNHGRNLTRWLNIIPILLYCLSSSFIVINLGYIMYWAT
jgi:hypothetical protein